jgi:CRISPR/Cas system CMR subunit Cmr4 (Cas7 group RAMP superfamily)
LNANLVVFPVPSNDKVYVQVNSLNIENLYLVDQAGRTVEKMENVSVPLIELNVEKYQSGSYILIVETNLGQVQRKVVIE